MSKVIVIGGGPSGIIAAIGAAKSNNEVLLIEKNDVLGKKLRITGGGRCNITNATDMDGFLSHTVSNRKFLYSALNTFSNADILDLLKIEGLNFKTEKNGRVFPSSDKSFDVIKALLNLLQKSGVKIATNKTVKELIIEHPSPQNESVETMGLNELNHDYKPLKNCKAYNPAKGSPNADSMTSIGDSKNINSSIDNLGVCKGVIISNGEIIRGDIVIVTTGGISYPQTGSTGDGYEFAKKAGHKISQIRPALVPLAVKEDNIKALQGISLENASISIYKGKKKLFQGKGEILFTHYGISGPLILNASGYCLKQLSKSELILKIDFLPGIDNIDKYLLDVFAINQNKNIKNALRGVLPEKLLQYLIETSAITQEKPINEISKKHRILLGENIKGIRLTIIGTKSKEAIITQGGVNIKEIDPHTMASKKVSGLKFAGEILDLDAETGGYNLQIAWSTGYTAGITCI